MIRPRFDWFAAWPYERSSTAPAAAPAATAAPAAATAPAASAAAAFAAASAAAAASVECFVGLERAPSGSSSIQGLQSRLQTADSSLFGP